MKSKPSEILERTLSHKQARRFYDNFGAKQDRQGFYEDRALAALIRHGGFDRAQSVLEVGCGTGKLAARLLSHHLPASARYVGIDLSQTMTAIARDRLAPWAGRTQILLSSGEFDFANFGGPFDRVIYTYVFDLLSQSDIRDALEATHAGLSERGLLCVAGLTRGQGFLSGATSWVWSRIFKANPALVGGCRPIELTGFLDHARWNLIYRDVVVSVTVPSEVIIAEAIPR